MKNLEMLSIRVERKEDTAPEFPAVLRDSTDLRAADLESLRPFRGCSAAVIKRVYDRKTIFLSCKRKNDPLIPGSALLGHAEESAIDGNK